MSTLRVEVPRVFKPLEKPDARYLGAHGGRGSGKSHYFAGKWLRENVAEKMDFVCLREIQRSLEFSVKKLLEQKVEKHNAGAYFEIQDRRILTKRGGTTIFEGLQNHTADSIKSLEDFHRAWVEEAHSLSQRSLDILRPTLRAPGSQIWLSWNPDLATDPVDSLMRGSHPPSGSVVVKANYRDNPWLPQVLKDEIEYDQKRDPDKFAHIWLGEYRRNSEARVFKNWRIEEFETSPEWLLRQGADWGFAVDPSVLVQCAIVGRTLYVIHEAYRVGCEIDLLPDLFRTVPDAERWPTIADSARPETISYMTKHGFPKIMPAIKGARSLEEGVEFLQSFDVVVHPRCVHAADELTLYSYKTDPLTGYVLPQLADKDNHVIDALRYACEGARRAVKPKPKQEPRLTGFRTKESFLGL